MKNIKTKTLIFAVIIFVFVGCKKVLDTNPGNTYTEASIYSDINLTTDLVAYNYNVTDTWGMNVAQWWTYRMGNENASHESWFHFTPALYNINLGLMSASNMSLWTQKWSQYYNFVGTANNFLSKIDGSPVAASNPDQVKVLKGEMMYLRAYAYVKLINFFGGVPLIKKPFQLTDSFKVARNSYDECVDFIVGQLDTAISLIPAGTRSGPDFGKVSQGACMALKSRVLLYAASDLHDPSQTAAPRGPLYDYTKASKWQDAADAAKALIDLNLYSLVPVSTPTDYQKMFLNPNSELIFGRPFNPNFATVPGDFNSEPDKAWGPVSVDGWGLSNPTHNLVQDFKMANGLRINDSGSGYDPNNMYVNRELRFYADILYNGATFRGKVLDYASPDGPDSKMAPGNIHFAATGYNDRKFMDETVLVDGTQSPNRPYPLARLPEIYLNYAEAEYHLGNVGEAQKYVSMVAQRVGLPAITSTGPALLADIKYERQMELFFEGHKFFDERRWMDTASLTEAVLGVQWQKLNGSGQLDPNGTLTMIGPNLMEQRKFSIQNYYLPIPIAEIQKSGMQQNFNY